MDEKVAAAAAAASRAEAVRLWEALFDEEGTEVAQALFMDALLRDARAEYARKEKLNKEDEEDRFAHVFEPWHLPPRGSVPMPPPPEQKVPDDQVKRTFVLGLRAPPHLARNRKRDGTTPTGPAAAGERHPPAEGKKPRVL